MNKTLSIIAAGIVGLALPIAGMTISPTRNLILGLAPDDAVLQLADKIDEERVKSDTVLQEMQAKLDEQQTFVDKEMEEKRLAEIQKCESLKKSCENQIKSFNERIAEYSIPYTQDCDSIKDSYWPDKKQLDAALKSCRNSVSEKNNEITANRQKIETQLSELITGKCQNYKELSCK